MKTEKLKKIKLLFNMNFVHCGRKLKTGMIVETIPPPIGYENDWGVWVWGEGEEEPIRLRAHEYEEI